MSDPYSTGAARFMGCLPGDVTEDERHRFKEAFFATLGARGEERYCTCPAPRSCVMGLPAQRCGRCGMPFKPVDMLALAAEIKQMGRFQRGDDPHNELCLFCDKHIRQHFGGTEYRCNPAPTLELTT